MRRRLLTNATSEGVVAVAAVLARAGFEVHGVDVRPAPTGCAPASCAR